MVPPYSHVNVAGYAAYLSAVLSLLSEVVGYQVRRFVRRAPARTAPRDV